MTDDELKPAIPLAHEHVTAVDLKKKELQKVNEALDQIKLSPPEIDHGGPIEKSISEKPSLAGEGEIASGSLSINLKVSKQESHIHTHSSCKNSRAIDYITRRIIFHKK